MKEDILNQVEKEKNVFTKTVSAQELFDFIYKGESLPQEKRFLNTKDGGVFENFEPRDPYEDKEHKFYPLVYCGEKTVGLAELQENPYKENTIWIKLITVDKNEKGKGYGTKLVEEIFRFAKERGFDVENSSYKEEGLVLKRALKEFSKKYDVRFIDTDKVIKK